MKRLILHIGTHKTGTTSIQKALSKSAKKLRKDDIYYSTKMMSDHNFSFYPLFVEDIESYYPWLKLFDKKDMNRKKETFEKKWLREFGSNRYSNFLISSENLCALDRAKINDLKQMVEPFFDRVSVIVYVREPSSYISSSVQEIIKNGNKFGDLKQTIDRVKRSLNYKNIRYWADVFGEKNIIVRKFDAKFFKNGDLIEDFFDSCDLEIHDIDKIIKVRANESIGHYSTLFLSSYNHYYPIQIDGEINKERGCLLKNIPLDIFRKAEKSKFEIDVHYYERDCLFINKHIQYINHFLAEEEKLHCVKNSVGENTVNDFDIPIEFFVELINEYNKRIEKISYFEYLGEIRKDPKKIYYYVMKRLKNI